MTQSDCLTFWAVHRLSSGQLKSKTISFGVLPKTKAKANLKQCKSYSIDRTAGSVWGLSGSLNGQNSTKMALLDPIWPILAQNHLIGPQGTLRGPVRVFGAGLAIWGTCRTILGHEGPFCCCFGSFRDPCGRLKSPQGGPIWHITMYYAPGNC